MTDKSAGNAWPEQEIILAWMKRRGIELSFNALMELQEELTKPRIERDRELAACQEELKENTRLLEKEWSKSRLASHASLGSPNDSEAKPCGIASNAERGQYRNANGLPEFRHRREDDAAGAYHIHSRLKYDDFEIPTVNPIARAFAETMKTGLPVTLIPAEQKQLSEEVHEHLELWRAARDYEKAAHQRTITTLTAPSPASPLTPSTRGAELLKQGEG